MNKIISHQENNGKKQGRPNNTEKRTTARRRKHIRVYWIKIW